MPGPAIAQYIEQDTYKAFKETCSVFRHDFAQYMGMLHSWMTLVQVEVEDRAPATDFYQTTSLLSAEVERTFQETTARLRPDLKPLETDHQPTVAAYVTASWDSFFTEFVAFAIPHIERLRVGIQQYTALPDFDAVVESSLGVAAEESIRVLLLRPFERLLFMLDVEHFDQRMAEVLSARQHGPKIEL